MTTIPAALLLYCQQKNERRNVMEKKTIDLREQGVPLRHFWSSCIGAGRAAEGLRADWQKQLARTVRDCGFRYIRFHGLLCDEMGICRQENGVIHYQFAYVDTLFDSLLEIGIRPIVEFGFMPSALASGSTTQFWWKGNVTPPQDEHAWADLLSSLVSHWIERYGREEVRSWYFEIWNEPNLPAFWDGTKSQYFRLYAASVRAIKAIDPCLRTGGPATSNFVPDDRFAGEREDVSRHLTHKTENLQSLEWKGVWLEEFLDYCHKNDLPVDFISAHPYPTDFALDGQVGPDGTPLTSGRSRWLHATREDLTWIHHLVRNSPYPNAEIQLTEWSSSPSSRDCSHDYLPEAAFIVKCNMDCIGLADSLSYWVFTDIFEEEGPAPEAFHGGFGLQTIHGIPKPSYHAYRMLHQLGSRLLEKGDGYLVTRDDAGKLHALICHYPENITDSIPMFPYPDHEGAEALQYMGNDRTVNFSFRNLVPGQKILVETLDTRWGNASWLWKSMGSPKNLTAGQCRLLDAHARMLHTERVQADASGCLDLALTLKPWSVVSVNAC